MDFVLKILNYCGSNYLWARNAAPAVIQKSAFTLIELLVYMMILGFVIVVAGRAFSDSTGMRVRSQNMLASAEEAGRISAILKEDISQMGAKSWGALETSGQVFDTLAAVYINFNGGNVNASATDLSSYTLTKGENFDNLFFQKVHYDSSGACGAIMKIEWHVREDSVLIRKCENEIPAKCTGNFNADTECPAEIEMASNLTMFSFLPSKPGKDASGAASDTIFPTDPANSSFNLLPNLALAPTSKIILEGFNINLDETGTAKNDYYLAQPSENDCFSHTYIPDEEYAINFNLLCDQIACKGNNDEEFNPMIMFQPGGDHLSVGLRDPDMNGKSIGGVPDFLFYPPLDQKASKIRHFEFSVPSEVEACIGITAAFYGPAQKGRLEIEKFTVLRKTDRIYHFDHGELDYNPDDERKASVKAFELSLGVDKKGEINRTTMVIPVPNNGVVVTPGGL
jgi:type II secretory pathway pseudopilin PulG